RGQVLRYRAAVAGEAGVAGQAGLAGVAAEAGAAGAAWAAGVAAMAGMAGAAGMTGEVDEVEAAGMAGVAGMARETGIAGESGVAGVAGVACEARCVPDPGADLAAVLERLAGQELIPDPDGELRGTPRGWRGDHPRIALARRRGLQVVRRWELGEWISTPEPLARIRGAWRAAGPLVEWLDTHVGAPVPPT
ncbi:MAG TPA: hypothetical protein VGE11_10850, partial [Pseudonocardia sp.]